MVLPRFQAFQRSWVTGYVAIPSDFNTEGGQEGIGSSNLMALNFVFFQQIRSRVLREKKRLRPCLADLALNSPRFSAIQSAQGAAVIAIVPWERLVDNLIHLMVVERKQTPTAAMRSSRPWILEAGNLQLRVADGWKLYLSQSFTLLLVALLPIRRKILQTCQILHLLEKGLLTLYTSLDLMLLVTTWLLCALAPAAVGLSMLADKAISIIFPRLMDVLEALSTTSGSQQNSEFSILLAKAFATEGREFLSLFHAAVPAAQWDALFFLKLAVGSLGFLGVSAAVARIARPGMSLTTCLSMGLCGPLWVFTEQAKDMDPASRAARVSLYVRTLLFAAVVTWRWRLADQFSMQLAVALIFNTVINATVLRLCWVALLVLHLLCGLAAINCVEQSLDF